MHLRVVMSLSKHHRTGDQLERSVMVWSVLVHVSHQRTEGVVELYIVVDRQNACLRRPGKKHRLRGYAGR